MKKKLFFVFTSVFFIYFLWSIFFNSLEYNTTTINHDNRLLVSKFLPEGWSFFTKSPREPLVDLYKWENGKWNYINIKNNAPINLFGISKKSRRIGMEISIMYELAAADSNWVSNTDIDHIKFPKKFTPISNKNLLLLKQGKYCLVKRNIVPWSWRTIVKNKNIKYEIICVRPSKV